MDMTVNTEIANAAAEATGVRTTLPLRALFVAKENVRKKVDPATIPELAESILAKSLLQNLVVVPRKGKKKSQTHAVLAGQRRYEALVYLAERGSITYDYPVPVLVADGTEATALSLIENVAREAMHPADELEAFAKLASEGATYETIGTTYGVSAMTVRRRLKLASVSPKLLQLLREDEISLEQLAALAISESHEEQERVWDEVKHNDWMSEPRRLRAMMMQEAVKIGESPIAKYVGIEAYEQAGGEVRRDLFSDADDGYITDVALLNRLALEKLEALAEKLRADGWAWVEVSPDLDYYKFNRYGYLKAGELPENAAKQVEELNDKRAKLDADMDALYDEGKDDEADALSEQIEDIDAQIEEIERTAATWSSEQMAASGAILYIQRNGKLGMELGRVRPNERPINAETGDAMTVTDALGHEKAAKERATHSDKMVARLTAHRTAAVQSVVMTRPDFALALLTARLAAEVMGHYLGGNTALQVRCTPVTHQLTTAADDMADSAAWSAIEAAKENWRARLPAHPDQLLGWMLQQDTETVSSLLAFCVALNIDGLRQTEREHAPLDQLVEILNVDMADFWKPTVASYFGHISKKQMIATVAEAVSAEASLPLEKMKKDAAAQAAEDVLKGVRWVPEPMRPRAKVAPIK